MKLLAKRNKHQGRIYTEPVTPTVIGDGARSLVEPEK